MSDDIGPHFLDELAEQHQALTEIAENWSSVAVENAASADLFEEMYHRSLESAKIEKRMASELIDSLDWEVQDLGDQIGALVKALARCEREIDRLRQDAGASVIQIVEG
jgi:hypothetical protein